MDKKPPVLVAVVVIVSIAAAAFYFIQSRQASAPSSETTSYGTDNPLSKKPDLNPVEKTNPFADIRTNPFE